MRLAGLENLVKVESLGQPVGELWRDLQYANVMPGTPLNTGWHIAHLTPEFRQVHTHKASASYAGARFREYGMSLGPQQVLNAKQVIVIISGQRKAELTKQLLSMTQFNPAFPLSIVHHQDVRQRVKFYVTADVFEAMG